MLAALNKYLYSLDETPGPRDVAALVAQFSPPETRRLPTHQITDDEAPKPGGPSTAVIPREAQGKRPKRAQTFATHVELQDMLRPPERPSSKLGEVITDERYDPTPLPSKLPRRPSTEITFDPDAPIERPERAPLQLDRPPSRSLLVLVGVGGLALTGAAIYTFYDGREAVLRPHRDAGIPDALEIARDAPEVVPDAAVVADAAVALDGPRPVRDAAIALARDAAIVRDADVALARPDAAVVIPAGTATLTIGANPWAKVFVDGKEMRKHAPATFNVSPGHHEIKLVFDAETPALEKTYSIDIKAGESQSYQADFTR
jgi:hypothetical protein